MKKCPKCGKTDESGTIRFCEFCGTELFFTNRFALSETSGSAMRKSSVIVLIVIGIISAMLLCLLGAVDDAPGLFLIGLVIAFFAVLWGLCKAEYVKWKQLWFILPLCFGAGSLILSVMLQIDGEFIDLPVLFILGLALGVALIFMGIVNFVKVRNKHEGKDN